MDPVAPVAERPVAHSVDALLAGATSREPFEHGDAKSGARFERVVIDGRPYVVKHLDHRTDWTMRSMGDWGGVVLTLWRTGVLDALPECFVQPIVGVAHDASAGPGGRATTLLMHDVGSWLVPEGDAVVPLEQHLRFLDHMAALHARFWHFDDRWGLTPMENRYLDLSPWTALVEREHATGALVPRLVEEGWARFADLAPRAASIVFALFHDLDPLVAGLRATPLTLVHGNWKFGNLGSAPDGRTVIFDWEGTGAGPACGELAWYLAINAARLPHTKEAAIAAYRSSLQVRGIDTTPWWDRQLALALLGAVCWFGWEKALGGERDAELEWWEARAFEGAAAL